MAGKNKQRKPKAAKSAESVRRLGRGGDVHLVHLNDQELDELQARWGAPSTNPATGLPEYGFFSKLKKAAKFELWHGQKIVKGLIKDPKRAILGVDPASTKVWNKVLGRNDQPLVDQLGGARSDRLNQYKAETGNDPGYAGALQNVAHQVAGWYAGGALGKLGGQLGSKVGGTLGQSGAKVGSVVGQRGATAAMNTGLNAANKPDSNQPDSGFASTSGTGNMAKLPNNSSSRTRDAWFTDAAREALGRASQLADRPYVGYGGDRVAGLSDNERQAGSMASSMGDTYAPMANRLQTGFSTDSLGQYMNPYTDAVLGARTRGINDEFGHQSAALDRNAAATDAFRSGRSDLARARLQSSKMRALDEATNQVKADAFESGKDSFFKQGSQDLGAIGALSGAASNQIGALNSTGAAERGVRQSQNDFNYGQFLEQRDWSMNNLNSLLSAIGAVNPAAGILDRSKGASQSGANWQAVAGLVGSAVKEYYNNGGNGGTYGSGSTDAGSGMSDWGGGNAGGGGFGGTYGA